MDKMKSLLINHGEKILAGVCALFGFLALSSAHWSTDNRDPQELVAKSKESQDRIEQNIWPEEEKVAFKEIKDVRALTATESQHKINPADYQMVAFNKSLIRSREKRSAVAVVPPTRPFADPIIVVIAMPPEEEEETDLATDGVTSTTDAAEKKPEDMTEEETLEALMQKKYGIKPAGGAAGMGAGGYLGGGDPSGAMTSEMGGGPGGAGYAGGVGGGGGAGYEGGYEGGYMGGMGTDLYSEYGGAAMMAEKTRVRVAAGVAVRLVVDVQEQRGVLRNALHLGPTLQESQSLIFYTDLQVERRQKNPDQNGWDEWQTLSSEDLGEILENSLGIDRDVVNPGVTRNTITMPLPRRAAGEWTAAVASHPDLENFVLSDKEKTLIDKFNQQLQERLDEEEAEAPIVVEAKGFSPFVQSATDMGAMNMYGSGGGGAGGSGYGAEQDYGEMYDQYESGSGGGKLSAQEREMLDATKATAENRLLLVRFMDFTVERGYTYQYRVRVELKNPNYNMPLDELEDPSLGTLPTLLSAWSEQTPPAFVPEAHRMYVADVDARVGRSESVKMTVFTDTTDTGMPMLGTVNVAAGMPIAGRVKQEVVDLTVRAVEERDVEVRTNAVLASAEEMMRLSTSDHPELKSILDQLDRGATLIPSQVTVIDSDGGIRLRAVGDLNDQEKMDEAEAKFILDKYTEAWKTAAAGAGDGFFGPGGDESSEGGYMGGGGLGMAEGSSAVGGYFGGGGTTGKKLSSRAAARAKRDAKKNGTFTGPGGMGSGGGYE